MPISVEECHAEHARIEERRAKFKWEGIYHTIDNFLRYGHREIPLIVLYDVTDDDVRVIIDAYRNTGWDVKFKNQFWRLGDKALHFKEKDHGSAHAD